MIIICLIWLERIMFMKKQFPIIMTLTYIVHW